MASEREQISRKVALIALVANLILMAGKVFFGLVGDSEAVFADGIHSAADVVASIAVLAVIGIDCRNYLSDRIRLYPHRSDSVLC